MVPEKRCHRLRKFVQVEVQVTRHSPRTALTPQVLSIRKGRVQKLVSAPRERSSIKMGRFAVSASHSLARSIAASSAFLSKGGENES